jgi:hypothetical protein
MIENKAGIRHRCPNLKHIWITLRLERGAYSVVKCEPPQVGAMLNEKFAKVLRAMAGHAKTVGPDDVFTCKFVQTFGNAQSEGSGLEVLKDLQPQPDMRTSVQLLGLGVERTNAVGAVPRFMDICNWHPLPGEAGYAFVLFEGPERKRMACEVKPVIREDGTCRVFALSKVVDGRRSRMQDIPFSMESRDERYGFPAEGIEISFTTLKNGDKAIRVDPFDQAREAESGAYGWKEKAAAALGLATAGGLLAFPEITGLLNNPFPESVAIGPYTITARYVLGTAAMTVLCAVGMLIDLFRSKNDTGDVK